MPKYWLPWPGKTKATCGLLPASSSSSSSSTSGNCDCKTSAATERSSCTPSAFTTGRTRAFLSGSPARPACSVYATRSRSSRGAPDDRRASARRCPPACRASGVLAESGKTWKPQRVLRDPAAAASSPCHAGLASSRMTWALVPPMPKELTPARRGLPSTSQEQSSGFTKKGERSRLILGFSLAKFAVGAMDLLLNISSTLISPVAPAAQLACAMLPFTEPRAMLASPAPRLPPSCAKASMSPRTSMPSPTRVPVQWHST
mmetsp:Transcript_85991/g.256491  ORF Transcript_85991/g.256491 Transcript_85991/m.256491 type:complete len:260 (-) Transcript_85991:1130-1909(-)